jgi:hypothetical protein
MAHNPPSFGASSSSTGNFVDSRSSPGNGANPSISGRPGTQAGRSQPFTKAGDRDDIKSNYGEFTMDQSVRMGSSLADPCPARDNKLPPIPPFHSLLPINLGHNPSKSAD